MYKSPIEKIYSEIQTQITQEDEKLIMTAIRELGVNVDKAELIEALRYDRNQYINGYEDGKNEVLDKIKAEILEEKECAHDNFERYKVMYLGQYWEDVCDSLPKDDFRYGMERCIEIIDKYKEESEDEG